MRLILFQDVTDSPVLGHNPLEFVLVTFIVIVAIDDCSLVCSIINDPELMMTLVMAAVIRVRSHTAALLLQLLLSFMVGSIDQKIT